MSQNGIVASTRSYGHPLQAYHESERKGGPRRVHIPCVGVLRQHPRSAAARILGRSIPVLGPRIKVDDGHKVLELYRQKLEQGLVLDNYLFVRILKACGSLADLNQARQVHAQIVRKRCEIDLFLGTALVDMYVKCGSLDDARRVFDTLAHRDAVSWNAVIAGYAHEDQGEMAWQLYSQMQNDGVVPHPRTLVSMLKACGSLAGFEVATLVNGMLVKLESCVKGHVIHAEIRRMGYEYDVFVATTLIDMYVKCGSLVDARRVFDTLPLRDVVSWNAMIGGYVLQEQREDTLRLYEHMRREAISPHQGIFSNVLKMCGCLADKEEAELMNYQCIKLDSLFKGKTIHAEAVRMGYGSEISVGTTLVVMYAKCGSSDDARMVFDGLHKRDVVLWNAMISGYTRLDKGEMALQLYTDMREQGVRPDAATFLSVLKHCSHSGSLRLCRHIQQHIVEAGLGSNENVASSLIDAFGKCGSMIDAQGVFDSLPQRDVVSWTALIAGYARSGLVNLSLSCFHKMQEVGVRPGEVTYLCALTACNHAGMVDRGLEYFQSMCRNESIAPTAQHYTSLIDLLGRAGLFDKVEDLLLTMPLVHDVSFWLSVMSACRTHSNVELGLYAFKCAVGILPKHSGAYVLMSNIYGQAGMWEQAKDIELARVRAEAWKTPCHSFIESHGRRDVFTVGDAKHPETQQIYAYLARLNGELFSTDQGTIGSS